MEFGQNIINTKIYDLVELEGYSCKDEAYDIIKQRYKDLPDIITVYYGTDGLWYIVQSKV